MPVFVGHDWAEDHHDVDLRDEQGRCLATARLVDGVDGVARFHALVAEHAHDPAEVVIATETDRGLFVGAFIAAGYQVYAVNPMSVARYRERHVISGAKSDAGDAATLAELARTDRHHHRQVAGDGDLVEAIKILARAHQNLIWTRVAQINQLRSTLREFYPAALIAFDDLGERDALAILAIAPTPTIGRHLSQAKISAALRRAGRQRYLDTTAARIWADLRSDQLRAPDLLTDAMGASTAALVAVITELTTQIDQLEERLGSRFESHPKAKIIVSLPGLAMVLGPRVLGEFGDDPNRYADAKSRKNYAGTSPVTRASGKSKAVSARWVRNKRLIDACYRWAFSALSASPGARAFYDHHKSIHHSHNQALRALANRLVGILHGCLRDDTPYDEQQAWGHRHDPIAA